MSGIVGAGSLLAGCAQTPMGPTVQVMPGPRKVLRRLPIRSGVVQAVRRAVGGRPGAECQYPSGRSARRSPPCWSAGWVPRSAAAGVPASARPAAPWAAPGSAPCRSSGEQLSIQEQYNNAFAQCMYAKGEMVPGYGPMMVQPPPPPYGRSTGPDARRAGAVDPPRAICGARPMGSRGRRPPPRSASIEGVSGLPVDGFPRRRCWRGCRPRRSPAVGTPLVIRANSPI